MEQEQSNTSKAKPQSQKCVGVVTLIDVLGAKQWNIDDAEKYLCNLNNIFSGAMKGTELDPNGLFTTSNCPWGRAPAVLTFGDTIAIAWELQQDGLLNVIMGLGRHLKVFMWHCLQRGIPVRGAVSYGEYILQDQKLLGPAVADAASWYDQSDWIGIVATPQFSIKIKAEMESLGYSMLKQSNKGVTLEQMYCEYDVPCKGRMRRGFALAWPEQYKMDRGVYNFYRQLAQFPIPHGTEQKYKNTVDFFDWYFKTYPPQEQKPPDPPTSL